MLDFAPEEDVSPGPVSYDIRSPAARGSEMTAIPHSQEIEYPESDGRPIAESQPHGQVILDLYHALSRRYADMPDVYV
jgi:hypothetical protein